MRAQGATADCPTAWRSPGGRLDRLAAVLKDASRPCVISRGRPVTARVLLLVYSLTDQPAPKLRCFISSIAARALSPHPGSTPSAAFHFSVSYSSETSTNRKRSASTAPNAPSSV